MTDLCVQAIFSRCPARCDISSSETPQQKETTWAFPTATSSKVLTLLQQPESGLSIPIEHLRAYEGHVFHGINVQLPLFCCGDWYSMWHCGSPGNDARVICEHPKAYLCSLLMKLWRHSYIIVIFCGNPLWLDWKCSPFIFLWIFKGEIVNNLLLIRVFFFLFPLRAFSGRHGMSSTKKSALEILFKICQQHSDVIGFWRKYYYSFCYSSQNATLLTLCLTMLQISWMLSKRYSSSNPRSQEGRFKEMTISLWVFKPLNRAFHCSPRCRSMLFDLRSHTSTELWASRCHGKPVFKLLSSDV